MNSATIHVITMVIDLSITKEVRIYVELVWKSIVVNALISTLYRTTEFTHKKNQKQIENQFATV